MKASYNLLGKICSASGASWQCFRARSMRLPPRLCGRWRWRTAKEAWANCRATAYWSTTTKPDAGACTTCAGHLPERQLSEQEERRSVPAPCGAVSAACCRQLKIFIKQGNEGVLQGLRLFDLEWENIQAGQSWAAKNADREPRALQLCLRLPERRRLRAGPAPASARPDRLAGNGAAVRPSAQEEG